MVHLILYQSKLENEQLSDNSILDEILTFIIAGSETTSFLLCMSILNIFKHKEVENKVRQEIQEFIKEEKNFNFDNLKKMKYMEWVQL